jgi:hypothetical protein
MTYRIRFIGFVFVAVMCTTCAARADEPCIAKVVFEKGATSRELEGVSPNGTGLAVNVKVVGKDADLRFVFDSGAGRTVLSRSVAQQLGLQPTDKGTIGGVGNGRVSVDIVKGVSLIVGGLRLDGVDLNLADMSGEEHVDGIIGYDVLCSAVVTLDFKKPAITVTTPASFRYTGVGEKLPLVIKGRWPFVKGTIKVPGVDPVEDLFLIDTGSEDAVNHPIIRQSKGPLRETKTGNGGFGEAQPGVIGQNEWFRIGSTTIPSTTSVCCASSEDVSRQLGTAVLSRFRITFNYPDHSIYLEKYP